jgi:hypothetical protein
VVTATGWRGFSEAKTLPHRHRVLSLVAPILIDTDAAHVLNERVPRLVVDEGTKTVLADARRGVLPSIWQ